MIDSNAAKNGQSSSMWGEASKATSKKKEPVLKRYREGEQSFHVDIARLRWFGRVLDYYKSGKKASNDGKVTESNSFLDAITTEAKSVPQSKRPKAKVVDVGPKKHPIEASKRQNKVLEEACSGLQATTSFDISEKCTLTMIENENTRPQARGTGKCGHQVDTQQLMHNHRNIFRLLERAANRQKAKAEENKEEGNYLNLLEELVALKQARKGKSDTLAEFPHDTNVESLRAHRAKSASSQDSGDEAETKVKTERAEKPDDKKAARGANQLALMEKLRAMQTKGNQAFIEQGFVFGTPRVPKVKEEKREREVSEEAMKQARARYEREKARGTSLDAMGFDPEIYEHLMKTTAASDVHMRVREQREKMEMLRAEQLKKVAGIVKQSWTFITDAPEKLLQPHPLAVLDNSRPVAEVQHSKYVPNQRAIMPMFGKSAADSTKEDYVAMIRNLTMKFTRAKMQHMVHGPKGSYLSKASANEGPRFLNARLYNKFDKDYRTEEEKAKEEWKRTRKYAVGSFMSGDSRHIKAVDVKEELEWQQIKNMFHIILCRDRCPLGSLADTSLSLSAFDKHEWRAENDQKARFKIDEMTRGRQAISVLTMRIRALASDLGLPVVALMPRDVDDYDKIVEGHYWRVRDSAGFEDELIPQSLLTMWLKHCASQYYESPLSKVVYGKPSVELESAIIRANRARLLRKLYDILPAQLGKRENEETIKGDENAPQLPPTALFCFPSTSTTSVLDMDNVYDLLRDKLSDSTNAKLVPPLGSIKPPPQQKQMNYDATSWC